MTALIIILCPQSITQCSIYNNVVYLQSHKLIISLTDIAGHTLVLICTSSSYLTTVSRIHMIIAVEIAMKFYVPIGLAIALCETVTFYTFRCIAISTSNITRINCVVMITNGSIVVAIEFCTSWEFRVMKATSDAFIYVSLDTSLIICCIQMITFGGTPISKKWNCYCRYTYTNCQEENSKL